MNCTEVIDEVRQRTDNDSGSPADYANRRTRLLVYLRETVDEIWWLRDFSWEMVRSTVTVPAGQGYASVPSDFHDWGHEGTLYTVDGYPMDSVQEREILDLRERNYRTDSPRRYSVFGFDAATGLKRIQIPYNDSAVVLPIWYLSRPPDLDEAGNNGNLIRIPLQYHRRVVVPGVRYRAEEAKSDARSVKTEAYYEKGKTWMLTRESRDQNRPKQLPSFFPGRN